MPDGKKGPIACTENSSIVLFRIMVLKNLQIFSRIVWARVTGRHAPLTVIFNVSNRCNCQCKHCYAAYYNRDASKEMTTGEAKRLILDLQQNGCQRISFGGGEPLLRKDIGELICYVNSLGMHSTLNSNGILVPLHLDELSNVDSLAISLDGKPEHHDLFRGEGTGEKALEAVIEAVEAGIRVHTNTVLHRHNLGDIDYMLQLASKYRFKAEFALVISNIFGNGISPEEIKPTNIEFRKAIKYIIRRKKEGAPVLFSADAYQSVLNCWEDFSIEGIIGAPPPEGMPKCPAGRFFCLIDADGTMWSCPHLIGKTVARNALEWGVAEAWRIAESHNCTGCYQVYHHELSKLMSLDLSVLWNYLRA